MIYSLYTESLSSVLSSMASDFRKRRLEKGLSRKAVSERSGVPVPTIARFETQHKISLESYAALCQSLDYISNLKSVMSAAKYSTMSELEEIKGNKDRKRGVTRKQF